MTYLISFFIVAGTMTQPVLTVHGSQQTCELAKAKLLNLKLITPSWLTQKIIF